MRQGEVIGSVGSTGLSTCPPLQFELRTPARAGLQAVDPGDLDLSSVMSFNKDPVSLLRSLELYKPESHASKNRKFSSTVPGE